MSDSSSIRLLRYHSGIVSLLDQIDPHKPAGPWKIIALHVTETRASDRGGLGDDQRRIPSSSIYTIRPQKGSTIFVRLTYKSKPREGSLVEVRLSNEKTIVTKVSTPLSQRWAMVRVHCPERSIRFLDIVHTGIDRTNIPLISLIAVEVQQRADRQAARRVKLLMEWASVQRERDVRHVLSRRRFSLV